MKAQDFEMMIRNSITIPEHDTLCKYKKHGRYDYERCKKQNQIAIDQMEKEMNLLELKKLSLKKSRADVVEKEKAKRKPSMSKIPIFWKETERRIFELEQEKDLISRRVEHEKLKNTNLNKIKHEEEILDKWNMRVKKESLKPSKPKTEKTPLVTFQRKKPFKKLQIGHLKSRPLKVIKPKRSKRSRLPVERVEKSDSHQSEKHVKFNLPAASVKRDRQVDHKSLSKHRRRAMTPLKYESLKGKISELKNGYRIRKSHKSSEPLKSFIKDKLQKKSALKLPTRDIFGYTPCDSLTINNVHDLDASDADKETIDNYINSKIALENEIKYDILNKVDNYIDSNIVEKEKQNLKRIMRNIANNKRMLEKTLDRMNEVKDVFRRFTPSDSSTDFIFPDNHDINALDSEMEILKIEEKEDGVKSDEIDSINERKVEEKTEKKTNHNLKYFEQTRKDLNLKLSQIKYPERGLKFFKDYEMAQMVRINRYQRWRDNFLKDWVALTLKDKNHRLSKTKPEGLSVANYYNHEQKRGEKVLEQRKKIALKLGKKLQEQRKEFADLVKTNINKIFHDTVQIDSKDIANGLSELLKTTRLGMHRDLKNLFFTKNYRETHEKMQEFDKHWRRCMLLARENTSFNERILPIIQTNCEKYGSMIRKADDMQLENMAQKNLKENEDKLALIKEKIMRAKSDPEFDEQVLVPT